MKPTVTLIRNYDNGDIETVELFKYEKAIFLHRHVLTKDEKKAKMYGIVRKFWDSFYCKQELLLMNDEIVKLVEQLEINQKP